MQFHILGLGPIGSLIAHNLRRYTRPDTRITLILKNKEQALRRRSTLKVQYDGVVTATTGYSLEVFDDSPPIERLPTWPPGPPKERTKTSPQPDINSVIREAPITSLIVAAKAHQTVPAIQQLQPRLSSNSTIVLLCNGMGVYEELLAKVFRNPEHRPHIVLTSNTHGAYSFNNTIVHAGLGSLDLAIAPDSNGRNFEVGLETTPSIRGSPLAKLRFKDITTEDDPQHERYASLRSTISALVSLQQLNVNWKPISTVQMAMRQKVVVNSVINPLTSIMRCRNGDIFSTQAARDINAQVCAEASRGFIAQIKSETAEYLAEVAKEGYDSNYVDAGRIPSMLMAANLEQEVLRVAEITKGNKSSMLADIEHSRETEIDYINGYLLRIGATFGISMPTIQTLYNLVKMRSNIPLDQML